MNPARIHFISDMPEPAAYFAKDFTKCAAIKENMAFDMKIDELLWIEEGEDI